MPYYLTDEFSRHNEFTAATVSRAGLDGGAGNWRCRFFPIAASQWWLSAIIFTVLAIPLLCWPNLTSTYLLVGCGFFLLHNFRIGNTAGSKGRRFCLCPIAVTRLKNHCSHRGLICAAMFWSKASIIREIPARTFFSTQSGRD